MNIDLSRQRRCKSKYCTYLHKSLIYICTTCYVFIRIQTLKRPSRLPVVRDRLEDASSFLATHTAQSGIKLYTLRMELISKGKLGLHILGKLDATLTFEKHLDLPVIGNFKDWTAWLTQEFRPGSQLKSCWECVGKICKLNIEIVKVYC